MYTQFMRNDIEGNCLLHFHISFLHPSEYHNTINILIKIFKNECGTVGIVK